MKSENPEVRQFESGLVNFISECKAKAARSQSKSRTSNLTQPALAIPTNMKPYPVAFLYPGPNYAALSDKTIPENLALQAAHLEGVRTNVAAGTQILAAPVMTPGSNVSALAVFPAHFSVEQVTALMQQDPAIVAGRFTFEVVQALFPSLDGVKMEY